MEMLAMLGHDPWMSVEAAIVVHWSAREGHHLCLEWVEELREREVQYPRRRIPSQRWASLLALGVQDGLLD
jgi:hypothetical protein